MSRLILWLIEASPPSCSVRMLGQILGLEFELRYLNFDASEHKSPEHLKRNPMGTVPVLQDGDYTISDSHAIMKYLLEQYGNTDQKEKLYPSDVKARGLVDQAMFADTGIVFSPIKNIALPAVFEGLQGITPKHIEQIEEAYGIVDLCLKERQYVAANHLTLADLCLGTSVLALHNAYTVDGGKFPLCAAWLARLQDEAYFKKIAVPECIEFGKLLDTLLEANRKKM